MRSESQAGSRSSVAATGELQPKANPEQQREDRVEIEEQRRSKRHNPLLTAGNPRA